MASSNDDKNGSSRLAFASEDVEPFLESVAQFPLMNDQQSLEASLTSSSISRSSISSNVGVEQQTVSISHK